MTSVNTSPMAPELAARLEQLRDIHLPDAVSWWPPAPGWWILLATILVAVLCLGVFNIRRRRSLKYRALRELERMKLATTAGSPPRQLAAEICILIRRIVVNSADGKRFVTTFGDSWGEFLAAPPHGMPEPVAKYIANAPYLAADAHLLETESAPFEASTLFDVAEYWIRKHA